MRYDGDRRGSYQEKRSSGQRYERRYSSDYGRESNNDQYDRRGSDYGRGQPFQDRHGSDNSRHGNYDGRSSNYDGRGYDRKGSYDKGTDSNGEVTGFEGTEEVDGLSPSKEHDTNKVPAERSFSVDQRYSDQTTPPANDRWSQLDLDRRFSNPSDEDRGGRYPSNNYERRGTYPNFGKPSYQRSYSENWGGSGSYGRSRDWGIPLPRNERVER